MALLKTLSNPFSNISDIEDAYCVIDDISIDKHGNTACFGIKAFLTQADRAACVQPFHRESFLVTGDAYTIFKANVDAGGSPVFLHAYTAVKASILDEDGNETNKWATAQDA